MGLNLAVDKSDIPSRSRPLPGCRRVPPIRLRSSKCWSSAIRICNEMEACYFIISAKSLSYQAKGDLEYSFETMVPKVYKHDKTTTTADEIPTVAAPSGSANSPLLSLPEASRSENIVGSGLICQFVDWRLTFILQCSICGTATFFVCQIGKDVTTINLKVGTGFFQLPACNKWRELIVRKKLNAGPSLVLCPPRYRNALLNGHPKRLPNVRKTKLDL